MPHNREPNLQQDPNRRPPPDNRDDYNVDGIDEERFASGVVKPEAAEDTPEAHEGLADETGIEIDNAIERPREGDAGRRSS